MKKVMTQLLVVVACTACGQGKPTNKAVPEQVKALPTLPNVEVVVPTVGVAAGAVVPPSVLTGSAPLTWQRSEFANLPWGNGPLQAGRLNQGEQNPEAPMALDADAEGNVWLLDQINERVVVLDGKGGSRVIKVGRTVQDLAVEPTGALWTLDRLVAKAAERRDGQSGAVLQTVGLVSAKIAEPGLTSGLFVHDGGVFVEVEHTALRRIAGTPGVDLRNRPSADGKWLLAALRVPPDKVAVAGRAPTAAEDQAPGLALQGQFSIPVAEIIELAGDLAGRVWLAADLVQVGPDNKPTAVKREAIAWGPDGKEVARLEMCAPVGPEEQFRTVRVKPGGALYNLCRGPAGVVIERWAP